MTRHTHIRPMRPDDWPAIEEIIRLIWDIGLDYLREQRYGFEVGGRAWHERKADSMRGDIGRNPGDWFVTESPEGRVIGFCSLRADETTGIGEVGHNGLHPDCRGKGLGSAQLRFSLAELCRRGMAKAEVQTVLNEGHAPARRMYERAGFEPVVSFRRYTMDLAEWKRRDPAPSHHRPEPERP